MNIANNLALLGRCIPEHTAIILKDQKVPYGRLEEDCSRFGSSLKALGIKMKDHVLLCHKNSYEWIVSYFGIIKIGAVAVAVPANLTPDELKIILDDSCPKAIVTDELNREKFNLDEQQGVHVISKEGEKSFYTLIQKGNPSLEAEEMEPFEPAAILYTGGTTGFPKGVILSHQNIQASYQNVAFNERTSQKDISLCFLPLNHVFAQIHIVGSALYSGATVVIHESFDLDQVLFDIQKHHITKFYGVPTIYVRLLEQKDLPQKVRSITYSFSAAASLAEDIARAWKAETNLEIHEAYGMTESASMVTFNHYFRHVVGSVGTPANLIEVRILTKEGLVKDAGVEGEICIRGPNIMKGYLNKPAETKEAFVGGWFRSGDVGFLDDRGYLFLVDRIKDLVITGGENVYPREVENALFAEPEIKEAVVFGVPDREYGERLVAMVVPKEGVVLEASVLRQRLKARLAPFKVPKEFFFVNEIPRTSAGKVQKKQLKEMVIRDLKKGVEGKDA